MKRGKTETKNTEGKVTEEKTSLPMVGGGLNPPAIIRTLIDHSENGGPVLDITEPLAQIDEIFRESPTGDDPLATAPTIARDGFDWSGPDVVLHHQRRIAVYENKDGNIVIRAEQDYPDDEDDPFFVIGKDSLDRFIQKLRSLQ